jgi:hypothetical protein
MKGFPEQMLGIIKELQGRRATHRQGGIGRAATQVVGGADIP